IHNAVKAGDSVAVVGLSGAGKSNLLGYLAERQPAGGQPRYVLVDGNRLADASPAAFLSLMRQAAAPDAMTNLELDALTSLEVALTEQMPGGVCFLLDLSLLLDRD